MTTPFFSQAWCAAATSKANDNAAMRKGFKNPADFNHVMAFVVTDRDELTAEVQFSDGRVTSWVPGALRADEMWAVLAADTATWRSAAEGDGNASKLLMAGRIKLRRGPIGAAIENAGALDQFVMSWGNVPTDWTA
jgi:hypothetical protein